MDSETVFNVVLASFWGPWQGAAHITTGHTTVEEGGGILIETLLREGVGHGATQYQLQTGHTAN
jgi:hypothetical protein